MFAKILIANRGEIACRVIRTARRMGIATVAVYSDADARSPHVKLADEAVHIGPSPAAESYLRPEKIIAACKATGAEAVHPGYGFLSERASFVEALEAEGIAFIGPPASAIAAMGDKIESKKLALAAGVNVVPGFVGEIADTGHAVKIAGEIGYPVMMKASAGGGGKGMRLAFTEQDVREGFEATRREGLNSFGDDRVFIEKFIEDPRHIEIQLLGDRHGTLVHLNERECSIQRRHQKVVEEAPSPFVTPKMRKRMGEQAIALARAVGYYSAGTVELIVSGKDPTGESFYFLEMNTRLQVEHPVTEAITGIDLVEQMIRVAAGEKLPVSQKDIGVNGWAIETRVYAEDPYRGFLPSTGRLVRYRCPPVLRGGPSTSSVPPQDEREREQQSSAHPEERLRSRAAASRRRVSKDAYIRIEDGVAEGGEVSLFYDPMIAKLITWASTRDEAADLQVAALDRFEIEGPGHNIDFLSALMQHPRFRAGELTTGFIAEEYPEGFHGAPADEERLRVIAAIAAGMAFTRMGQARQTSGQLNGPPPVPCEWTVRIGGHDYEVTLGEGHAMVDQHRIEGTCNWMPGRRTATASGSGQTLGLMVARQGLDWLITTHGARHRARALPARLAPLAALMLEKVPPDLSRFLICPMPGLLVALNVAEGDKVEPGQPLATVEAMKMENILRAHHGGTVKAIMTEVGQSLAADAVILELRMTFDYEAYLADFLTGDDDALVARWFAPDCAMESGSGTFEGHDGMRRFLAWAHDGVRECPRIVAYVQQGLDLFAEIDMDFHATKERADFPFQHLYPGDSITVKFLAHYILNEEGKVWRLKTMTWPAEKGVSKLPPLGPHPSQMAAYGAYTAAFSNGNPERYTRFYTDDVELLLGSVPPMRGPQAIADFYTAMFKRVRESLTVHGITASETEIVSDTTSRFTAIADAPDFVVGALGKGDYIEVRVIVTYTLREGLIERIAVKRAGEPVTYRASS